MNIADEDKRIREEWFPNHKATYKDLDDVRVLTWKQEGTICYYVRYVFDNNKLYISGDLGEAVFCFTEYADVHVQSKYGLEYFESKLRAYHEDRKSFNSERAVKRLREWVKDLKQDDIKYDHDNMRDLFESARGCNTARDWEYELNNHYDFVSELDCDYWEWMYGIGEETPLRIRAYLIGLKMAAEQLKNENKKENE